MTLPICTVDMGIWAGMCCLALFFCTKQKVRVHGHDLRPLPAATTHTCIRRVRGPVALCSERDGHFCLGSPFLFNEVVTVFFDDKLIYAGLRSAGSDRRNMMQPPRQPRQRAPRIRWAYRPSRHRLLWRISNPIGESSTYLIVATNETDQRSKPKPDGVRHWRGKLVCEPLFSCTRGIRDLRC